MQKFSFKGLRRTNPSHHKIHRDKLNYILIVENSFLVLAQQ